MEKDSRGNKKVLYRMVKNKRSERGCGVVDKNGNRETLKTVERVF